MTFDEVEALKNVLLPKSARTNADGSEIKTFVSLRKKRKKK